MLMSPADGSAEFSSILGTLLGGSVGRRPAHLLPLSDLARNTDTWEETGVLGLQI